tara:strand:+ start:249 stop:428 length:180 start_codon:yes stop_codon:yes gene_type:complete
MEKITEMKINKDGSATVYVPKDQVESLMWILSEGEAGIWDEQDDTSDTEGWRGWEWRPR